MLIIKLNNRRKKQLFTLWEVNGYSFEQTWIPFTQGCFVPNLVEFAQRFWRRFFFNFVNVFSLFRNYLPLEKCLTFHLNKLKSSSLKEALCQVWLKLTQWFRRRFLNFVNVLSLFFNNLPLEKRWSPSFEQIWIPFTQGVGWNWSSGSGEEDFWISSMYFAIS